MNLLDVRQVRADHDGIDVLFGVDLTVAAGTVCALVGPNGAGKSTLLDVIAGLHRPRSGTVHLAGRDTTHADPVELARRGVCLVPEGRGVFPNLTVDENLRMMTATGTPFALVQEASFARFPRLAERRTQVAGTMSGGEQQMLALARALVTDPALLLLDELSMGLAPIIVHGLFELVAEIAADGVSVLIVEQFASNVQDLVDRAAVLVHGEIVDAGPPSSGIFERLPELYLGSR